MYTNSPSVASLSNSSMSSVGSNTPSNTAPKSSTTNIEKENAIKGFKGLRKTSDGKIKCRDLVYEPGLIYVSDTTPKTCAKGFHFCEQLDDVFTHYAPEEKNVVYYTVKAWGEVDRSDKSKFSSQFIQICEPVKEIDLLTARLKKYLTNARKVLNANKNAVICGSLALIIRGYIPFRTIKDIDIMMPFYSEFEHGEQLDEFGESGNQTKKMCINDGQDRIEFDLFINPEETWSWITIDGYAYKVAHAQKIIEAKMKYYMNGNHKHGYDLVNIMNKVANGNFTTKTPIHDFENPSDGIMCKEDYISEKKNVFLNSAALYPASTKEEIQFANI